MIQTFKHTSRPYQTSRKLCSDLKSKHMTSRRSDLSLKKNLEARLRPCKAQLGLTYYLSFLYNHFKKCLLNHICFPKRCSRDICLQSSLCQNIIFCENLSGIKSHFLQMSDHVVKARLLRTCELEQTLTWHLCQLPLVLNFA